jgi:hypothetical protein
MTRGEAPAYSTNSTQLYTTLVRVVYNWSSESYPTDDALNFVWGGVSVCHHGDKDHVGVSAHKWLNRLKHTERIPCV